MSTCFAYHNPIFQPSMRIISSITNSFPAIVTTTFAHQYVTLTIVRIDIPQACGMQQLNGKQAEITVTSATTFTIPIDTTNFDLFTVPVGLPEYINTCAQVVPFGEDASTLIAAVQNVLPFQP